MVTNSRVFALFSSPSFSSKALRFNSIRAAIMAQSNAAACLWAEACKPEPYMRDRKILGERKPGEEGFVNKPWVCFHAVSVLCRKS